LNRITIAMLEKMKYHVIYADTDSVMFIVNDDDKIIKVTKEINIKLTDYFRKNYSFTSNLIILEYEKKFKKFIMIDKKRYIGHLVEVDGSKVDSILSKGVENIRRNTIEYTKEKMNELIDLLLKKDKSEKVIKKWLQKIKKEVLNENIPFKKLIINTKLSKATHKYKSKAVHVRLAEKLIKEGKILQPVEGKSSWGTQIKYIITSTTPKLDGILAEDADGTEWDRKYYWDTQIYAPLKRILKTVWPDSNWDEHNIMLMEKLEMKKEKEKEKIERQKEKERKKKEKEAKSKKKKKHIIKNKKHVK